MARKPAAAKRAKTDWKPNVYALVNDYALDTLHISDLYRRRAWLSDRPLAAEIVDTTRRIGVLATYLEPAGGDNVNKDTVARIRMNLRYLAVLAQEAGAENVVLPTVKGSYCAEVLDELSSAMKKGGLISVCMQSRKAAYKLDLDDVGKIDPEKSTALDKGVRGLWEIEQKLWTNWDQQCNLD